jgi:hypothetical protein
VLVRCDSPPALHLAALVSLWALGSLSALLPGHARGETNTPEVVWLEAEAFSEVGGWVVDQQFMDLMGSPYLLAHGLGVPVPDAVTRITLKQPGSYRIWVRTRDWVAPWNAPGAPGRFQVLIDGDPLPHTFGTVGDAWHWEDGGIVELGSEAAIALHDLTGFAGRCDAVLLARDLEWHPPDGGEELARLRGTQLGWNHTPQDGGEYDLVVVGGGVAGTCAAIAAARLNLNVALIQDRPVLGGNGSSEVRVWPEGETNFEPFPRIGDLVNELIRKKTPSDGNAKDFAVYDDQRKLQLARAEARLTLKLEHRVNAARVTDDRIVSVVAQQTRSGQRFAIRGKLFVDCTGDGVLGSLAGADFEMTEEGHMGMSNLWNVDEVEESEFQIRCACPEEDPLTMNFAKAESPQPFPRCPWAVDMSDKDFPGRNGRTGQWGEHGGAIANLGGWFWESGFDLHPIADAEKIRDLNLRAMYGAWDALKNVDGLYPNHRLKWAAFIAGKRESRRLLGDVVLTAEDFRRRTEFQDLAFPCTWHIDLHLPDPAFFDRRDPEAFIARATTGEEYRYEGPYWAPYRCLYSRNIRNLFMAGRDISVSHDGLGAVRVMRTCGMMGEVVGMAAAICHERECEPRDVYLRYLDELHASMRRGVGNQKP